MDLERIYDEKRLFQVVVREPGGPEWLPEAARNVLSGFRPIRRRLTQEEALEFAELARGYPGQEKAEAMGIFD
jgi:hypothetical protein